MNSDLNKLQTYPFEKLAALKAAVPAPSADKSAIMFSIGEPKHAPPGFVVDTLKNNLDKLSSYPATKGIPELRKTIAAWLTQRFHLRGVDAETQVIPVNGTREALFSFAQAVVDRSCDPVVISPNPFYQIYEGAALLSGAQLHLVNCTGDNGYLPDFSSVPADIWRRCQLIYICTPGNPSGAVMPMAQLKQLIALADQYDFVIASDECYSELYFDEASPPPGLLQACAELNRHDFARCVVFHSLSKRSNLPGLRSGFVAGDSAVLQQYLLYRTYHGCALSTPVQLASLAAWQDEQHVIENRRVYLKKFTEVLKIIGPATGLTMPDASFYLWLPTAIDDQLFTQQLYSQENITVLPGSYLSRSAGGLVPGQNHVRIALVANLAECIEGATRLRGFLDRM